MRASGSDPEEPAALTAGMEEEINCAIRACCRSRQQAIVALTTILEEYTKGTTAADYAECVLTFFALAPKNFAPVAQEIGRLARLGTVQASRGMDDGGGPLTGDGRP